MYNGLSKSALNICAGIRNENLDHNYADCGIYLHHCLMGGVGQTKSNRQLYHEPAVTYRQHVCRHDVQRANEAHRR